MKSKLLVILGATSTGKTDLALSFAKKLNGQLISADSRQVYKYLDIGTGKKPGHEVEIKKKDGFWMMDRIKVWLYDIVSPQIQFSLYEYILKAKDAIKKISENRKLPILVGGTGFYIRSLLEGLSAFGFAKDPVLRKELAALSPEEIGSRIYQINPEIFINLNNSEAKNALRLIRIYEKLTSPKIEKTFIGLEKNFDVLKIGLKTDRKILRERIKQRLLKRIEERMIEESKKLLAEKILTFDRMEDLGLEYRYIAKFLKGEIKTQEELVEILSLKIGQYAKRQETWFKKEKNVIWFDILENDFNRQVEKRILDWYNTP